MRDGGKRRSGVPWRQIDGIGASHHRALDGLKALADAGVLRQITEGGYDRCRGGVALW